MEHYAVRVWLPDRPGALGQVASRIGAVRGDVVGIEILERGAGRAIDELVVALPEPGLVDLLVNEIAQVDGVDVEDVRSVNDPTHDPRLDALETAARLVEAPDVDALFEVLCADAIVDFDADWGAVLRPSDSTLIHAVGSPPRRPGSSPSSRAARFGSRRRGPCRPGRRRLGDAPRCRSRARARPQGAAVPGSRASGAQRARSHSRSPLVRPRLTLARSPARCGSGRRLASIPHSAGRRRPRSPRA